MIEFEFETNGWESVLNSLQNAGTFSAMRLIQLLENEDDDAVDIACRILLDKQISLDLSSLPKGFGSGEAEARLRLEKKLSDEGLNLQDMDEKDSLRIYLEELESVKADAAEESALASMLIHGSTHIADRLVNHGLYRVVTLAKEYVEYGVLLMDLIQEGNIGLWEAIQNYHGGNYPEYRDYHIRQAFARTILLQARNTGVIGKMRSLLSDYRAVDEKLLMELGRNPVPEEIAEALHISLEEVFAIQKMLADVMLIKSAKEERSPEEEDASEEQAVEDTAYYQMRQRISDLLSQLSELDAKILSMRFGLDHSAPMAADAVARKLGMTVREVTQRETAALQSLRQ